MAVLRANVDFAKRIFTDRVGNPYVYGGNWNPLNLRVGTDCSGLVVDICDAVRNGTGMAWTRHGMSTETWRPIEVGETGTIFNTVCVASPNDFPADAAVKIALHHGPGGGANSHMWCEVEGVRMESNGDDGCVTGDQALSVFDSYANDWHYIPGPIGGGIVNLPTKDQHALDIIREGQRRGITVRGQKLALATGLVESNITIYANSKVPDSMTNPLREAVGSDGYSVGIFQQQVVWGDNGWWWGDSATCMDPTKSAGLFYDRLSRLDYNGPNSPGSYAQTVQQSAFPDRYDERFADAEALYNRLIGAAAPPESEPTLEELLMSDALYPSISIYANPGEGPRYTLAQLLQSIDGMKHREMTEEDAEIGDLDAITRIARVAAGQGQFTDAASIAHARLVLANLEENYPDALKAFIAAQNGSQK